MEHMYSSVPVGALQCRICILVAADTTDAPGKSVVLLVDSN